jgi:hypothetical protein
MRKITSSWSSLGYCHGFCSTGKKSRAMQKTAKTHANTLPRRFGPPRSSIGRYMVLKMVNHMVTRSKA